MPEQPFPNPRHSPISRPLAAGERLFEFTRDADVFVCELRDDRESGVEVRLLRNGRLYWARHLPSREQAIAWTEYEHRRLRRGDDAGAS